MILKLRCAACSFSFRGRFPDDARRVKCPKCAARIDVPPPEDEIFEGEIVADGADSPPVVLAAAPEQPNSSTSKKWELLRPNAFAIVPRSIMGGLVYKICDADTDEVVGRATEKVDAGKLLVGFLGGRQMMAGTMALIDDANDKPVIIIERANFQTLLVKPCQVQLRDHRDQLLAKFKFGKPFFGGIGLDFDGDCSLFDAAKEEWAIAEGPKKREPDYAFIDGDGNRLARVRGKGKTQGFMSASNSWTGKGGWLKLSMDQGIELTPAQKLILLGATIAFESIITTLGETKPGTIRLN